MTQNVQAINFTPRLDKAIKTAAWAHEQQGQHRKGTDIPYIMHPFGVMLIASQATHDEDVLIACLFHDILEDVDSAIYNRVQMKAEFGERVAGIVDDVTKNDTLTNWRQRSEAYLNHMNSHASNEAVIVCAADKIHNLMSILTDYETIGDDLWQRFTTKSSHDQLWWYESIFKMLVARKAPSVLVERMRGQTKQLGAIL